MATLRIRLNGDRATGACRVLRASGYLFVLIGALAVGSWLFVWVDAGLSQRRLAEKFEETLLESPPAVVPEEISTPSAPPFEEPLGVGSAPASPIVTRPPEVETALGEIEIKAAGVKAMILEGVETQTLRRAVGHVPGTPLPGESGNVALAGHRDSFFRGLRNLQRGDQITLATARGIIRYQVDSIELVGPEHTEVLADSDESVLTLVTCYPFTFVGPAPERFVVRARLATTGLSVAPEK